MIFRNRAAAGEILARWLKLHVDAGTVLIAIPNGGVPVALSLATHLNLSLHLCIATKIRWPADPRVGLGAISESAVHYNDDLLSVLGVGPNEVNESLKVARQILAARKDLFFAVDRPCLPVPPDLEGRKVALRF